MDEELEKSAGLITGEAGYATGRTGARRPDRAPCGTLKIIPFEPAASSDQLGWAGLQAARYRAAPASELNPPALNHHRLILFSRPPEELDLLYEGVERHVPPPAASIAVVPAGAPVRWRWSGCFDWLHIFLEPGLFALSPPRCSTSTPCG